jgi:hypothetical protein
MCLHERGFCNMRLLCLLLIILACFIVGCASSELVENQTSNNVTESNTDISENESNVSHTVSEPLNTQNPEADSKIVLDEYMSYLSYDSVEEKAYNLKKRISFSSGDRREILESDLEYYEFVVSVIENFDDKCNDMSSFTVCSELVDEMNELFDMSRHQEIKSSKFKELDTGVMWEIALNVEVAGDTSFTVFQYVMLFEDGEWKVINVIDENGEDDNDKKRETKISTEAAIKEIKLYVLELLGEAQKAKLDECWAIQYNEKLTTQRRIDSEKKACYTEKYIDTVKKKHDVLICDEISDLYYYALCYSYLALETNNYKMCDVMVDEEYEAVGFRDPLNSRDMCYDNFLSSKPQLTKSMREKICQKMVNKQTRTNCLMDVAMLED